MIKINKLNNIKVRPIKSIQTLQPEKIKGYCYFNNLYSNIFLLGKKASGKTSVIYNILKKCINKKTVVYFFVSTIHKDASYDEILKMLDNMGVEHHEYTSIFEGKENYLEQIIEQLQQEPEVVEKEKSKLKLKFIKCDDSSDEEEPEYRPKKISPEVVFIFDDVSNQLSNNSVSALLKKNRHFKSKTLISSQYIHDLRPESIQQLDYMLMFPNIPLQKLDVIYKQLDLAIDFKTFIEMYKIATQERYHFLYISIRDERYLKDFNYQFQLEN